MALLIPLIAILLAHQALSSRNSREETKREPTALEQAGTAVGLVFCGAILLLFFGIISGYRAPCAIAATVLNIPLKLVGIHFEIG